MFVPVLWTCIPMNLYMPFHAWCLFTVFHLDTLIKFRVVLLAEAHQLPIYTLQSTLPMIIVIDWMPVRVGKWALFLRQQSNSPQSYDPWGAAASEQSHNGRVRRQSITQPLHTKILFRLWHMAWSNAFYSFIISGGKCSWTYIIIFFLLGNEYARPIMAGIS